MVNVGVVGAGFVGLTHAAVTAVFGHKVVAYDSNIEKIKAFNSKNKTEIERFIYEKNLSDMVIEQVQNNRLKFSNDPKSLLNCEVLFMCLPTPYKDSGESDLTFLFDAAGIIADVLKNKQGFVLFVDKSTVPIGTAKKLYQFLESKGLKNFDVASNPEFLPEGDAVASSLHSHKVIVGANRDESFKLLRQVYSGFVNMPGYVETNPETAEAIKYASNTLLYSQIVAWQAIPGKIGEAFPQVDFDVMKRGILADSRIASWGSFISAGAGGSCFKKDALSLNFQLNNRKTDASFVSLVNDVNEKNKSGIIHRTIAEGYDFKDKTVAILGVSFKRETNDMRESNALKVIPLLLELDVKLLKIHDPLALAEAKRYFGNEARISYHETAEEALKDADATFIATDHREFKSLSDAIANLTNKPHLLIDGRRAISASEVNKLLSNDVSHIAVGSTYRKSE
jgi:UDPglucose 6-dehydrogenase